MATSKKTSGIASAPAKKSAAKAAARREASGKKTPAARKTASGARGGKPVSRYVGEAPVLTALPGTIDRQQLKPVEPLSLLTDFDIALFSEGKHFRLYEKMGAHAAVYEDIPGVYFAVWAPDAAYVSVTGDFNEWDAYAHTLFPRWDNSGIWEGFIPHLQPGRLYKYFIRGNNGQHYEKGDPFATFWEVKPRTASIIRDLDYKWRDGTWMKNRGKHNALSSPMSVYEVHLGSWRRPEPGNEDRYYTYRELTEMLVPYVKEMGFTHIELMPVMEHPFDGSWGYQQTGYFAPTSRYGTPQEFMEMIDAFHRAGIGVILDWVPSHFPYDAHGLFCFDGSHVYEYADMRKGFHPDWNSYIFNYGRNEVRAFLISNALFWLDKYHVDGLRVDAVASMIYLNYSRKEGGWAPNEFGGSENLEALSFLRQLNVAVYGEYPDVQTIAEESTSYYGVSKPTFIGGLGFGMKWMMGWMNDTLDYFKTDPLLRQWRQNQITFSIAYGFSENFMLPLSHDEVVHGKSPMIYKMPGDDWKKFANLRLLYSYMFTHPGTKLLFMGNEFAQTSEWNYKSALQWELLEYPPHQGVQQLIRDLNALYRKQAALYEKQFSYEGFEWNDLSDHQNSILIYVRMGSREKDTLLVILNMTPVPREDYRIGLFKPRRWKEIFNSDDKKYGGSGVINRGTFTAHREPHHGKPYSIQLTLPPLGAVILKGLAAPKKD
ncbi:1,4-alpha-glucan branching protein GlgB [Compostibacter hankyongensis]|uniref:1,4-alpha-glucan branching enzyme GlgB n=1 Tax=Compostibacter hankyongensis TaxID=1007089 RepID=A0ABP8FL82_9BACT